MLYFYFFPGAAVLKNPPANAGDTRDTGSIPGSGRSPGVTNGNPLQNLCLKKSPGQKSLVGYSPWGFKESDTTRDWTYISYVAMHRS